MEKVRVLWTNDCGMRVVWSLGETFVLRLEDSTARLPASAIRALVKSYTNMGLRFRHINTWPFTSEIVQRVPECTRGA